MKSRRRLGILLALAALAITPACASCDGDNNEPNNSTNNTNNSTNNTANNANNTSTNNTSTNNTSTNNTSTNNTSTNNTSTNNTSTNNTSMNNTSTNNSTNNSTGNNMMMTGEVVTCNGEIPAPSGPSLCDVTAGSGANVVLRGTVLAGDKVYENGAVIYEGGQENGAILYVGCDWEAEASAQDATVVACADGVISAGLINAHDHITYNAPGEPKPHGDERFDHRHDWRRGIRGHDKINHNGNDTSREAVLFSELRHVLSGATSLAGSGGADGFMRNLDRANANGGLSGVEVDYSTFPLGDTSGELRTGDCDYNRIDSDNVLDNTIYLPHVAEGIDPEARNEFACLSSDENGGRDLLAANTSIIHGIGLKANDIAAMAAEGAKLVWSPRSNIDLYGQTADIITYRRLGVTIGLGTDWVISGSMNMLRELACADYLNTNRYNGAFSDFEIWRMATAGSAATLGVGDRLGDLDAGRIADIAIFDASQSQKNWRAILEATPAEVSLVLRGGQPLYGDAAIIEGLASDAADTCETIDVCSRSRRLCAERDTGLTLDQITQGADNPPYPLFFCDIPDDEPTCVPSRPNEYDGMTSATDQDGDGVEDSADVCPTIFDPKRPLSDDEQPNFDMDGGGDACDVCPISGPGDMCEMFDPNDRDGDGVSNADDNCPQTPNADQANADGDDKGDLCDQCPMDANPGGQGCPASIYAINQGMFAQGDRVVVTDAVVSGVGGDGFFIQVPAGSAAYTSADYSGIFVFARELQQPLMRGDRVEVDATIGEFFGGIQLTQPMVTVSSSGMSPAPEVVAAADLLRSGAKGEAYEGLLVQVDGVTVDDVSSYDQYNEVALASGLYLDDILFAFDKPEVGDTYEAVIGCVVFRDFSGTSGNRIAPRDANDLITGPAALAGLAPQMAYLEAGTTGEPLPGLKVQLTSPAQQDVTVNLSYSDAAVLTGPASVTVSQGQTEAALDLTGVSASATAQTVTASYDGDMATASVTVYDAATPRQVIGLSPAMASVAPGGMTTLTVTLDVPAAAGGQSVDIATSGDVSAPATVTVPAGQFEADFQVTGAAMGTSGSVTASVGGGAGQTANVTVSSLPSECLIISEYVEGSSNNKALELYNCGASPLDLTNFHVCLVTNNNTDCGNKEDLTGMLAAGATLVLCNSNFSNAACTQNSSVTNFNGNDRILVFTDADGDGDYTAGTDTIVDALGDYDMPPSGDPWKDMTLQRCDFTPYTGGGTFDASLLYTEQPQDTFSDLGVAPMMGCP